MQRFNGNYKKMKMAYEHFIIKKEDNMVICRQGYYIDEEFDPCTGFYFPVRKITVTGIARCSKDDVFNETKGRRIAQTRANMKAYNKYYKWAKEIRKSAGKLLEKYINTCAVANELHIHELNKLDDFMM